MHTSDSKIRYRKERNENPRMSTCFQLPYKPKMSMLSAVSFSITSFRGLNFHCRNPSLPSRYFIFFGVLVNGSVYMISFSVCLLLVYRKTFDLCKLILCPATLLTLFMISTSFLVGFLRALMYSIMSSANMDNWTSSFPT